MHANAYVDSLAQLEESAMTRPCDRFTSAGDVTFTQRLVGGAAIFVCDVLCGSKSFSGLRRTPALQRHQPTDKRISALPTPAAAPALPRHKILFQLQAKSAGMNR